MSYTKEQELELAHEKILRLRAEVKRKVEIIAKAEELIESGKTRYEAAQRVIDSQDDLIKNIENDKVDMAKNSLDVRFGIFIIVCILGYCLIS